MLLNIFSSNKSVGLDIGTKNIKVIALSYLGKKKFKLINCKILPLPKEILSEKSQSSFKNIEIATYIKSFFSKNRAIPREVAISVGGPDVVIRYLKIPVISKEELVKSIPIEAEPFIPFPLLDVNLSFDILGEVLDEGVRKTEVVIVAVRKDFINSKMQILKEAKLTPIHIDVDIFVLENLMKQLYETSNNVFCIINIGANTTNVGILEVGVVRVTRDLPIGIMNIINEIKKSQPFLKEEDIVQYLKTDGFILTEKQKEEYLQQDKKTELSFSKNLQTSFKDFVTELHKIIDFYYFQKGEQKPLTKIYLSGGGSIIKNLDLYFSQEFKLDVEYIDPFRNIVNASKIPTDIRPIFAVAAGLAMKQFIK